MIHLGPSKCAHQACKCDLPAARAAQGDRYCSDLCAAEADDLECSCGHDECSTDLPQSDGDEIESVISLGPEVA